jgi:tetratricopeptide (TPR) repeat protein
MQGRRRGARSERSRAGVSRWAWVLVGVLGVACAAGTAQDGSQVPAAGVSTEAGADEPQAAEGSEERIAALRSSAGTHYAARDWRACADAYVELSELAGELGRSDAYNGACCLALAGDLDTALTWLERAASLGWRDVGHLQSDGDLVALHQHARWPEVVAKVQANLDGWITSVNRELYEIYQADQGDRMTPEIDWSVVSVRDRQRQARVLEIVEAGEARAADDWFHAAMVMQHGESLDHYQRAHDWALKASELDPDHRTARWLAAAAKDRWLMNQGKPQLYGTQFVMKDETWVLYEVDPTITDEERARWNVPPLAVAQARAKAMNER